MPSPRRRAKGRIAHLRPEQDLALDTGRGLGVFTSLAAAKAAFLERDEDVRPTMPGWRPWSWWRWTAGTLYCEPVDALSTANWRDHLDDPAGGDDFERAKHAMALRVAWLDANHQLAPWERQALGATKTRGARHA